LDVRGGQPADLEPRRHRLGGLHRVARGIGRVDLDQLLIDFPEGTLLRSQFGGPGTTGRQCQRCRQHAGQHQIPHVEILRVETWHIKTWRIKTWHGIALLLT
jgi:hypothetical protein